MEAGVHRKRRTIGWWEQSSSTMKKRAEVDHKCNVEAIHNKEIWHVTR